MSDSHTDGGSASVPTSSETNSVRPNTSTVKGRME